MGFTFGNCLFGSVKLTKNADLDKCKYTGYSIGFNSRSEFHYLMEAMEADMSSSLHVDNKGKYISILGEGPTQGIDDTTLRAEAKYPINFTQ